MSEHDLIAPDDRAYLYGDALFETVRVRPDGSIRWLNAHIDRLRKSGHALGFGAPQIEVAVEKLLALADQKPGIWRVTVSRDGVDEQGQRMPFGGTGGVRLRFRAYRAPKPPKLGLAPGFYLPNDRLAEHKTTSYMRSVEVRRRAMREGYDDAIMTSRGGLVGEASCANLIVVREGRAATPPICGVLPGVTRGGVVRLAADAGHPIAIREITVDELHAADEIMLLSAGVGLLAAASFQGRVLDDAWASNAQNWLP